MFSFFSKKKKEEEKGKKSQQAEAKNGFEISFPARRRDVCGPVKSTLERACRRPSSRTSLVSNIDKSPD